MSILAHIGSFIYQIVWVMPATKALYSNVAMPGGLSSLVTFSSGIGIVFNLLIMTYPIAVLIILLLPSTSAAFRGTIRKRREEEEREDEEDDDDSWHDPPRSDKFRE